MNVEEASGDLFCERAIAGANTALLACSPSASQNQAVLNIIITERTIIQTSYTLLV